ncbi:MAG: Fur family transcriptional regulator [Chthoniobacterales bacterium]
MEVSDTPVDYPEREHVLEHLRDYLQKRGCRRTVQRDAIIKAAFSTREHFSAEALLELAKGIDASVSRATVYRTLPLLVESGLLRELDLGGETKVYDPNFLEHPTHNHLICVDCDRIVEFEDTNMELLENCITRRLGFSPINKSIKIEAHCDELAQSGQCRRRDDLSLKGEV